MIDFIDSRNVAERFRLRHIGIDRLDRPLICLAQTLSLGFGLHCRLRSAVCSALPGPGDIGEERCRTHFDLIEFGGIAR